MSIKKPKIANVKIKQILSLLGDGKIWDDIEDTAACSRPTISLVTKWYNSLSWSEAKVLTKKGKASVKR